MNPDKPSYSSPQEAFKESSIVRMEWPRKPVGKAPKGKSGGKAATKGARGGRSRSSYKKSH